MFHISITQSLILFQPFITSIWFKVPLIKIRDVELFLPLDTAELAAHSAGELCSLGRLEHDTLRLKLRQLNSF